MMNKIMLLQFDWSGTISDDRIPVHEANMRMCDIYGIPKIKDIKEWLKHTKAGPQQFFKAFGVDVEPSEIWDLYKEVFGKVIKDGIRPVLYNGAPEVLDYLKKKRIKLAVISSHPTEQLINEAQNYNISNYFDFIEGSITETDKPKIINKNCESAGVKLSNTAYVGDTIFDILAAKKAKALPIGIAHGYHSIEMLRTEGEDFPIWEDLYAAKKHF